MPEVKHVAYDYLKSEIEWGMVDFEDYQDTVKKLPQDKFPTFFQKQVRGFMKLMLVLLDMIWENDANQRRARLD